MSSEDANTPMESGHILINRIQKKIQEKGQRVETKIEENHLRWLAHVQEEVLANR